MTSIVNVAFRTRRCLRSFPLNYPALRGVFNGESIIATRCEMALRLVSGSAGVCALYLAFSPLLSGIPSLRPLWMHILLWASAVCLLTAAFLQAKLSTLFASLGSVLVFLAYAGSWLAYTLAKVGYLHVQVRLIAVQENWFDHWRLLLDGPVRALLLVLSVASFLLALRRISQARRIHP